MRRGRAAAIEAGVVVRRGERVVPMGSGWLIRGKGGFTPCAWAEELVALAAPTAGERAVDLGAGGGILMIALHQKQPDLQALVGIERTESSEQAGRNLVLNGVDGVAIRGDVRRLPLAPRAFDLVVSNPPFYPAGWGRQSADSSAAAATHALAGDIGDFAQAASHCLAPHGRAVFVYDAGQLVALLLALADAGLVASAVHCLDDDRGQPARVLVRAQRGVGMDVVRRAFTGPKEWI